MTAIVTYAQREFDLDFSQLHNDSTTVTFTGTYSEATGQTYLGQPTRRITHGHNKDHRPDLKQLLYVLTTTADGAVPIWCNIEHGNKTDDQTHIETWEALRRLVGNTDFLYVADSKLCTKKNMAHIAGHNGRFVTVLPKTRREDTQFRDWLQTHEVPWCELVRRPNSRRKNGPDEVYRGFESPIRSVEGYRIIWFWSSQKFEQDRETRQRRIDRATSELEQLRTRMHAPRSRLKAKTKVEEAAAGILADNNADRWLKVEVKTVEEEYFKQATAGRPNKNTRYVRHTCSRLELEWSSKVTPLQYDNRTDGIFSLVLNDEDLSMLDALLAYKHQPCLEKRFQQFKSVFEVMPVWLRNPARIEAFLFIYFLALFVEAIIEREIRRQMKLQNIPSLPLYPEQRPCKCPTADRIFGLFVDIRRHHLLGPDDSILKSFRDELTSLQCTVLGLLGLSPEFYFSAGNA